MPRRFPDPGHSAYRVRKGDHQERHVLPPQERLQLLRREEEAVIQPDPRDAGKVRLRKRVDRLLAEADVPRKVEDANVDRRPAEAGDSGEVEYLPDGSISIPIFEEEIVVTKRMVVRERLIVRKEQRVERVTVPIELQRERLEITADPDVEGRVKRS